MARDIEEFLRRAAERRQQQKNQGQKPAARAARPSIPEIEVEIVQPPEQPRQKQRAPRREMRPQSDLRKQSVSDHVSQHLDTSNIAKHAESLGQRIAGVHDKVDQAIHRRLDRNVGKIDDRPTVTDDPRPGIVGGTEVNPIASDLLQMLSNPESIRQAILLSEILNRPDWDSNDK